MTKRAESVPNGPAVWPGGPLRVPAVTVFEARLVDARTLVFADSPDLGGAQRVDLDADFYLREFCELDAADSQAVLAFCKGWGPIGDGQCSYLHDASRSSAQQADAEVGEPWKHFMPNFWETVKLPTGEQLRLGLEMERRLSGLVPVTAHSVGRVAVYQASLMNAIALWRFISGGINAEELASGWRLEDAGVGLSYHINKSWGLAYQVTTEAALADLADHLNPALVPFHVRLEAGTEPAPRINVYQAACLQLANDVANTTPVRHCANERCGKLFTRQRGRGDAERHRLKGVRYCTDTCARAQAQREARRRKEKSP
jgi:hypothetical protein